MSSPRIMFFDIETTNLKADFGILLCIGYKFLNEKRTYVPSVYTEEGTLDEKALLKTFAEAYNSADVVVSYFGKGFDSKFLNAKMVQYNLPPLANIPHIDLFYTVKANFALSRKSLANVAYFFELVNTKTPVEGRIWLKAMHGDKASVKYIIQHCKADVLVLEEVYEKIKPYVRQHPRVNGFGPCRVCGQEKLISRGEAKTVQKSAAWRYSCTNCGAWETRRVQ